MEVAHNQQFGNIDGSAETCGGDWFRRAWKRVDCAGAPLGRGVETRVESASFGKNA